MKLVKVIDGKVGPCTKKSELTRYIKKYTPSLLKKTQDKKNRCPPVWLPSLSFVDADTIE